MVGQGAGADLNMDKVGMHSIPQPRFLVRYQATQAAHCL
jgi:hypothetical protein